MRVSRKIWNEHIRSSKGVASILYIYTYNKLMVVYMRLIDPRTTGLLHGFLQNDLSCQRQVFSYWNLLYD